MSDKTPQILVAAGPLQGRRFDVPPAGLRLGRSSSCEVSIKDPALSRSHCLFELRDGKVWVTDLASANGTLVNGEQLGADSFELKEGDRVEVGDSVLTIVADGQPATSVPAAAPAPDAAAPAPVDGQKVDLGLGSTSTAETPAAASHAPRRFIIWAIALLVVAGSATAILLGGRQKAPEDETQPLPKEAAPTLETFTFEKIEADTQGVYRYALSLDRAGVLTVEIDDVPKANRHVNKSQKLSAEALARLSEIFASPALYKLESEEPGVPLVAGTLKSFALHVVRGDKVFTMSIENKQAPDVFREVCDKLETFSKNELGIWAIQVSAEKLVEKSRELRREGDAKWEERDVQYGNLAAAIRSYNEAIVYLDTVNPKPEDYGALVARRDEAKKELTKRYEDQLFRVDRASNLQDWETANQELRILCEMVPDSTDPRHAEAAAKKLDVENRMKKKGKN